jgi:formate dehydrogenase major subunit
LGCALDKERVGKWFEAARFVMVQDYFLTDTARQAHLIMPASLPFEMGGSFTNTLKQIQSFEKERSDAVEFNGFDQLNTLLSMSGMPAFEDPSQVLLEIISVLPEKEAGAEKYRFVSTDYDNAKRAFMHGCDALVKSFNEEIINQA